MSNLMPYIEPILTAFILFPFVAALVTLPFTIRTYRRLGGISLLRTLLFYSFILYLMCAFLLTVLPLPSRASVDALPRMGFRFTVGYNLISGLKDFGFDPADLKTLLSAALWKRYLVSSQFFQILANVIMLIPLGIYLRYYFRFSFKKTCFLGFLTSLFFEMTQLSGLFFIYSRPYRCPDINDLITNTLGAAIGFLITPLFIWILPKASELDYISWKKGEHVTWMREGIASVCDWIVIGLLSGILIFLSDYLQTGTGKIVFSLKYEPLFYTAYFVLTSLLFKGRTPGKMLLNLTCVTRLDHTKKPGFVSYVIRFVILYIVYPLIVLLCMLVLGATAIAFLYQDEPILRYAGLVGCLVIIGGSFLFFLSAWKKGKCLPHSLYSNTTVDYTVRPKMPEHRM